MDDLAGEQSRRQRVEATLEGIWVDRPPFTFWYHFPKDQVAGEACAKAHLDHYARHRLDFLKVMNDNGYPAPEGGIASAGDLSRMLPAPLDAPEFQNQLDALKIISHRLGDETVFITTLFNPFSVLGSLSGGRAIDLAREDPGAVDYAWRPSPTRSPPSPTPASRRAPQASSCPAPTGRSMRHSGRAPTSASSPRTT